MQWMEEMTVRGPSLAPASHKHKEESTIVSSQYREGTVFYINSHRFQSTFLIMDHPSVVVTILKVPLMVGLEKWLSG